MEWKEPLGKGLRITSKIVGAVSNFVPFAGIVKGATSMVADMLDPPVTLNQIRDCSSIMKPESKPEHANHQGEGLYYLTSLFIIF